MHLIPPPVPRDLLLPLLACLPTAFISPRPPPALLPLLSPILRQRVNLLSTASSQGNGGWLSLLSWDAQRASKLADSVKELEIEPHPVSGELEIQDITTIQYRRLDEETLQCRFELDETNLLPVYVWCDTDDAGGGPGWKLAELRALQDTDDGTEWFETAEEATEASQAGQRPGGAASAVTSSAAGAVLPQDSSTASPNEPEDDDDYWASYDRTPGRTPARTPPIKRSPAPDTHSFSAPVPPRDRQASTAERDYYARYAAEVQPALDNHDPDEAHIETSNSTLNGDALLSSQQAQPDLTAHGAGISPPSMSSSSVLPGTYAKSGLSSNHDSAVGTTLSQSLHGSRAGELISAPRPTSPGSSQGSASVSKLEQKAGHMTQAEVGVKQFVSTEVKSLFRLARSVGIEREEFERIVKTELEVLGMLEEDD